MQKLFALLFLTSCAVALSVLVMTKGWGLHVQSWGWVIGAGVIGQAVIHTVLARINRDKP